jgi:hypothetical protein
MKDKRVGLVMNRVRAVMIFTILMMVSIIGNSFTLGYGITAKGYNLSFSEEKEIFMPEKNETVFSLLDDRGDVLETRVLNRLTGTPGAEHKWVVDYGRYKQVKNMVSGDEPYLMDDRLYWPIEMLENGDIFYEGYTSKALPVQIRLRYILNDEEIAPERLPGATGTLKVIIEFKNQLIDHEKIYYENIAGKRISKADDNYVPMVVQGTMPIDLRQFSKIAVSTGSIVEVGRTANASFMIFPYPDAEVTITLTGKDIELEPISITAMPQMPPVTGIEMADDLKSLLDGIGSLQTGMEEIYAGLKEISAGTALADQGIQDTLGAVIIGLEQMEQSIVAVTAGMDELYSGLEMADKGIGALLSGVQTGTGQIAYGLMELYDASDQMLTGLEELQDEMNQIVGPMTPVLEQINGVLKNLEKLDNEATVQLMQGIMDMLDELLEWIRETPTDDLDSTFNLYRDNLSGMSASVEEQEQMIREILRTNDDIIKVAQKLIDENPEGSDLYMLGAALLEQNDRIVALETQMQDMKNALANLHTTGSLLESQVDDLVDQLISRLEELMSEVANRYGMSPDYFEQVLTDLRLMIEYLEQMNDILPSFQEQISQLIMLPGYLNQLVEGQRMIRDAIKLIHDEGVIPMQEGIADAESLLSLQQALAAIVQMSEGTSMLVSEGFTPLQEGLENASASLSLAPLLDAQNQINAGISRLIREGLIPIQQGLGEGVDELLYAEEKLDRMQTLADSYHSFADNDRNQNSTVRFIIQTQAVKMQRQEVPEDKDADREKPLLILLWERFIALFRPAL